MLVLVFFTAQVLHLAAAGVAEGWNQILLRQPKALYNV